MLKNKKLVLISALATAVAVMGIAGGAVWAKSNGGVDQSARETQVNPQMVLADRVAGILGLDNETVEAAFIQAQAELSGEREAAWLAARIKHLDRLVEEGKMTQEEAAEMKAWLESKPDVSVRDGDAPNSRISPGYRPGRRAGPGMMPFPKQRGDRLPCFMEAEDSATETDAVQ